MATQLALNLQLKTAFHFDNYIVGDNQLSLALLQAAATGSGEPQLFIWGQNSCGKSHLLQAACATANQKKRSAGYLPLAQLWQHGSEILQGFEQSDLLCIDDVHCIAGHRDWQEALFHFINELRSANKHLICAASLPPNEIDIQLEDLRSRLNWGPVLQIKNLNDNDKLSALQLRAQARGYDLPENVAHYLLNNFARDLPGLFERLDQLEIVSLQQQRKMTLPFVKQVFAV